MRCRTKDRTYEELMKDIPNTMAVVMQSLGGSLEELRISEVETIIDQVRDRVNDQRIYKVKIWEASETCGAQMQIRREWIHSLEELLGGVASEMEYWIRTSRNVGGAKVKLEGMRTGLNLDKRLTNDFENYINKSYHRLIIDILRGYKGYNVETELLMKSSLLLRPVRHSWKSELLLTEQASGMRTWQKKQVKR